MEAAIRKKRVNVTVIACLRCRSKKRKCDGGSPCSSCVAAGLGKEDCVKGTRDFSRKNRRRRVLQKTSETDSAETSEESAQYCSMVQWDGARISREQMRFASQAAMTWERTELLSWYAEYLPTCTAPQWKRARRMHTILFHNINDRIADGSLHTMEGIGVRYCNAMYLGCALTFYGRHELGIMQVKNLLNSSNELRKILSPENYFDIGLAGVSMCSLLWDEHPVIVHDAITEIKDILFEAGNAFGPNFLHESLHMTTVLIFMSLMTDINSTIVERTQAFAFMQFPIIPTDPAAFSVEILDPVLPDMRVYIWVTLYEILGRLGGRRAAGSVDHFVRNGGYGYPCDMVGVFRMSQETFARSNIGADNKFSLPKEKVTNLYRAWEVVTFAQEALKSFLDRNMIFRYEVFVTTVLPLILMALFIAYTWLGERKKAMTIFNIFKMECKHIAMVGWLPSLYDWGLVGMVECVYTQYQSEEMLADVREVVVKVRDAKSINVNPVRAALVDAIDKFISDIENTQLPIMLVQKEEASGNLGLTIQENQSSEHDSGGSDIIFKIP